MSDPEVLEQLISEARDVKQRIDCLSDSMEVHGRRFLELGNALVHGARLRDDFAFKYCDAAEAKRMLDELPQLRSRLENLEFRIKRRCSLGE